MQSTVEPAEGNKVKLRVEVPGDVFEHEVDAAFKRMAREVRLPGFRPGKVPRKVLEARVGVEAARNDALQHALPEYYAAALAEHDVDAIAPPEIEITAGEDTGPVAFDATVEVRPEVTVGGYASLRVVIDSPEPTDEEVEERVEHLREQFSTLADVDRPAAEGDTVTIDISGARDGEPLDGLTAEGYQYRVGAGSIVPELDANLEGAGVGDTLEFTADHPQEGEDPVDFTVVVNEVRETVLPDLDDAFAAEASEFSTVEELRTDLRTRLATVKASQAQMAVREGTADELAKLVEEDPPEALVETEMQTRLQDLALRLRAQGIELAQYLQLTGQDPDAFREELRTAAQRSVRVDLALRAVAVAEGIDVDDDDLDAEIEAVAARVGQPAKKVRQQFERNSQLSLVRSDVRTRKAMDWVLEHIEVVDRDGNALDREALLADEDDHDHDHGHDHGAAPSDDPQNDSPDEQDS
ncbi:trigger factor [Iamia sp. SCSIO 61187]|uniref:trigger factor n=1 Tax=Iamia sp. SCSIO 61187 TaxID=2722752 RepID=UPI001C62A1EE|nr:trigger factor [Iamia sp. SCSIO 61187]QYG92511.1 trigger factor [Iamia sp. SCSIO 61187]